MTVTGNKMNFRIYPVKKLIVGKPMIAKFYFDPRDTIRDSYGKPYVSGFHVYTRKPKLTQWEQRYLAVVQVKGRLVIARGTEAVVQVSTNSLMYRRKNASVAVLRSIVIDRNVYNRAIENAAKNREKKLT